MRACSFSAGTPSLGGNLVDLAILFAAGTRAAADRAGGSSPASPAMISNSSSKSARCMGRILSSACRRPFSSSAQDHLGARRGCGSASKNMCSVRQSPMPSAPKARGLLRVARRIGIGAHAQPPLCVRPAHQRGECARQLRLAHLGASVQHLPRAAVDGDDVALLEGALADLHRAGLGVDAQRAGAATRTAAPCRARRRRRGSSCRRARSGCRPRRACRGCPRGSSRGAPGSPRGPCALRASASSASNTISPAAAPGEAGRPVAITSFSAVGIDAWDAEADRAPPASMRSTALRFVIRPFARGRRRCCKRRLRRALARPRLQHPELAVLDGELDVLHVAVVRLERGEHRRELAEELRHQRLERRVYPRPDSVRARSVSGCGVRMPATTSSPCALSRNSP